MSVLLIGCGPEVRPEQTVRVGAVLPLSGWGAYWGEPVRNGLTMAMEDIRARDGEAALSIIIEDGQSTSPGSVSAAQKLLSVDRVDAVYVEFSGFSAAVSPVVLEANKTLMYSAFNPKILELNPHSVKGFIDFEDACERYGEYAKNRGFAKVAIVNQFADVPPACIAGLSKTFPSGEVILHDNLQGNDFRTILLKLEEQDADAVVLMLYEEGSLSFLRQKKELGADFAVFCDTLDCGTPKIRQELGSGSLDDVIVFEPSISAAFEERYLARFPSSSASDLQPAGFAYEHLWMLYEALRACDGRDPACAIASFGTTGDHDPALMEVSTVDRRIVVDLEYGTIGDGGFVSTTFP